MICLLNIKTVKLAQIHGQLFEKYEENALNSLVFVNIGNMA